MYMDMKNMALYDILVHFKAHPKPNICYFNVRLTIAAASWHLLLFKFTDETVALVHTLSPNVITFYVI